MKKILILLLFVFVLTGCSTTVVQTKVVDKEGKVIRIENEVQSSKTQNQITRYLVIVGPGLSGYEYYVLNELSYGNTSNTTTLTYNNRTIQIKDVIKQIQFFSEEELEELKKQYKLQNILAHE